MAKGVIQELHPLHNGVLFHALQIIVSQTFTEVDLVIRIRYDPIEVNFELWMPSVDLIHKNEYNADNDNNRIGNIYKLISDIQYILDKVLSFELTLSDWDNLLFKIEQKNNSKNLKPVDGILGARALIAGLREF